jgi:hypothetical protein
MMGESQGQANAVHAVCLCPPGSNIVCYAFRPNAPATLAEINHLNRTIFDRFTISTESTASGSGTNPGGGPSGRGPDAAPPFFVSRTSLSPRQYAVSTVGPFLSRLGVSHDEYAAAPEGVFLLRSVLMNPWYSFAKRRGRYYISELVTALYAAANLAHSSDRIHH